MEKMKKIARGLDVFCRVIFWFVLVFGVLLVVLDIALLVLGPDLLALSNIDGKLTLGRNVSIQLSAGALEQINGVNFWILGTLSYLLAAGVVCWVLRVIRRILTPMREGRPFDAGVSGRLRLLGWVSIAWGVVINLYNLLLCGWIGRVLQGLDVGTGTLEMEHVLDGSFLVIALLLFLFSYIFRYGKELQKLSDETL